MKLVLTNISPPIEYPLNSNAIILGSAEDADIFLSGDTVAGYHAVIRQEGGRFLISCLNDSAEIMVNGHPIIQGHTLWPKDEIKIGTIRFLFQRDDAQALQNDEPALTPSAGQKFPTTTSKESETELKKLETLDTATLEKLRQKSPSLKPASGLTAFLKQGLSQAGSGQNKSIFGLMFTLPAISLSLYQKLRARLSSSGAEAFPEGTWQFYTQFNLREDPARHANETEGFHRAITTLATEVDQITTWIHRCSITLFEYESLLENEWVERTLLRLIHEAISEAVVEQMTVSRIGIHANPNAPEFADLKEDIRQNEIERIEIEAEDIKRNFGLANLPETWIKRRPFGKPPDSAKETYPQYRRRLFLEFLAEAAERLPATMGATVWDRYYDLSSTAMPAYQKQMSILYALKAELQQDQKQEIPIWQAKIGLALKGRYYLFSVAHHDRQGRLLAFKPGTPDDPGEPLILRYDEEGHLIDQNRRRISIDRKGNVTISIREGQNRIKVLRPTPPEILKGQIAAILETASRQPRSTSTVDIRLAEAPRAFLPRLIQMLPPATQTELTQFEQTPIIINWDQRNQDDTLFKIRSARRGIGHHALTIFRTEKSFVFDQSHIFYDAIWGMMISQIITDGAIDTFPQVSELEADSDASPIAPLRLAGSRRFYQLAEQYPRPAEVTAETSTLKLVQINYARKLLAQLNIPVTVNDLLAFYRTLHDRAYTPGLALQRALMQFRVAGHGIIADEIEADWQTRRRENISLLLPMDASFIEPRLRLFPATFKNFLPDFSSLYEEAVTLLNQATYNPTPQIKEQFLKVRGQLLANLLVMVEYFNMLKRITRQGESLSTAAIKYLAHLPPGMQGTLDMIPQHVGALNEILKGQEVFSNVGRVAPTSSLVRFMSAKDDGQSKKLVWGVMCDRDGVLKVSLRDFRSHIAKLSKLNKEDLASLVTQDYLEAYARGLNQFAEDLARIALAQI